jgi:hypothetical protein
LVWYEGQLYADVDKSDGNVEEELIFVGTAKVYDEWTTGPQIMLMIYPAPPPTPMPSGDPIDVLPCSGYMSASGTVSNDAEWYEICDFDWIESCEFNWLIGEEEAPVYGFYGTATNGRFICPGGDGGVRPIPHPPIIQPIKPIDPIIREPVVGRFEQLRVNIERAQAAQLETAGRAGTEQAMQQAQREIISPGPVEKQPMPGPPVEPWHPWRPGSNPSCPGMLDVKFDGDSCVIWWWTVETGLVGPCSPPAP